MNYRIKKLAVFGFVWCLPFFGLGQSDKAEVWAQEVIDTLSLEEKIGQLFMAAAYSNKDEKHVLGLQELVDNNQIGGFIFFQGDATSQVEITNQLQKESPIPLMIGLDAEWGVGMRISDVPDFPKQMMLGASNDPEVVYEMAYEIAYQCKEMGIHVNFAPVVDVNINPKNPVIGVRSFAQDQHKVSALSEAYMNGLQDNGVLACAKHFPGHGDTEFDSHKTLPAVIATRKRIDTVELEPYRQLIKKGLRSVMAAHLHLPALNTENGRASSLSPNILNGLLREEMGFNGLVFTDALNMKGVSDYYESGELELLALKAGNDVLLFSEDIPGSIEFLKKAVIDGQLDVAIVDRACKRILIEKHRMGLNKPYKSIDTAGMLKRLNRPNAELIYRRAAEKSITLVKDKLSLIPLNELDTLSIAAISIGNEDLDNAFLTGLNRYSGIDAHAINSKPDATSRDKLTRKLRKNDLVIIGVHGNTLTTNHNFGVSPQTVSLVRQIAAEHKTIVCVFASPYSLDKFYGLKDVDAVIMGYEDRPEITDLTSQGIFGGIGFKGHLPVDASVWFKYGDGIETEQIRLKYTIPLEMGLDVSYFNKIDSLMENGIKEGAYPGGQLFIAKEGKVIVNKGYGHHTYDKERPVKNSDLYDLASVTKIAATTASVMRLTDEGLISIDSTLGKYIPDYVNGTPYENVKIREMMAHQAGFFPWLPFYRMTMKGNKWKDSIYSDMETEFYNKQVAKDLYINEAWRDTILWRITQEPISSRKKYKYSDFGFYMLHKVVETITNVDYPRFTDSVFYAPLGMSSMTFNPLSKFSLEEITPTENDTLFRKRLVHGFVHDQGAAMMGGVSGHAGLFSNANDLGIMMNMFLNKGSYAGKSYISDSTLTDFTRCQYKSNGNRRGAGFDKPVLSGKSGPTCYQCVSMESFGHTGFTGITAWADPGEEVIYIFMSNRVYPIAENKKILTLNVRTDIQSTIYEAINKAKLNGEN